MERRTIVTVVLVLLAAPILTGGKLDEAREEVRGSSPPSSSGSSSTTDRSYDDGPVNDRDREQVRSTTDHGSGSGALDYFCLVPVILPFCLPVWAFEHAPFEDWTTDPFAGRFPAYPYAGEANGHLLVPDGGGEDGEGGAPGDPFAEGPALSSHLSLRMVAEYAYDLDGALHRPGGSLLLDTSLRFGLESAWSVYVEPLAPGVTDELTFGDVNVFFRLAQSPKAEFRMGLGANLMLDGERVDAGFNGTVALDVFPIAPLILSLAVDMGMLGRAFALRARGTIGLMLSRVELFAGYDVHALDDLVFHGPLAGLRVWI
jgi:hypothetical protein